MPELPGTALLFCPADRPDRFGKAADRADGVILDLEDAVAPDAKAAARDHLIRSRLDPARTVVRVNAAGTPDLAADLAALRETPYRLVMLAKAEGPDQVERLAGYAVVALCETARGVLAAPALAARPEVVALMWGAEDLVASLGGSSSRFSDGRYRDVARTARASVLLAAGAHGKAAVDAIHADLADLDGLAAEVADAVASGFVATACIHPSQVPVVRAGYAPTDAELAWAGGVLDAARSATSGVFTYEGRMIDGPLIAHARRIMARRPVP